MSIVNQCNLQCCLGLLTIKWGIILKKFQEIYYGYTHLVNGIWFYNLDFYFEIPYTQCSLTLRYN